MAKLQITLQVWGDNHSRALSIQGEAGSRTVEVTFLDASGTPIDLTGCTPRMVVDNGAPEPPMNDGMIVDAVGGIADFMITSDMLTRVGDWPCEFALAGADYPLLKANGLELHVDVSNTENAVGSTNQLASLWIALNKADTAAALTEKNEKDSETAVTNANAAITTVTANESTRQTNEQTRQSQEATRQSNENARKAAETDRAGAESTRATDESTRQTQEQSRKDAESARATAETTREGNESTRKGNEAARLTAESTRTNDEDTRKTNETARRTAESARTTAESARASAESERVTDEKSRADAESSRVSAESDRVTAESARATAENQRVTDSQTAVSNADAATSRANAAAQSVDDAIKGDIGPAVDSEISKKVNVANGIAGLDASGKVAPAQLPAMDYLPTSEKGAASGVASLDANGKLVQDAKTLNGKATSEFLNNDDSHTYGVSWDGSKLRFRVDETGDLPVGRAVDAATLNGHPILTASTSPGAQGVVIENRLAGSTVGHDSVALNWNATASASNSFASGESTKASGVDSNAEGSFTEASGEASHAEGRTAKAWGAYSHAEGYDAEASGPCSHAEGNGASAMGEASHAEGYNANAYGTHSHAEGTMTNADVISSHAQGQYNKKLAGDRDSYLVSADAMVIGNGILDLNTSTENLSNCFRVTFDGKVYGLSSFNSSGADYSEFFEWLDENPNKEDRVGHFVALDGEKIKYANDGDYTVGIVSGAPAIIGDHPSESWSERWVKDVFGRIQTEEVDVPETQEKDKGGNVIRTVPAHTETRFKVNPAYDPTKEADYLNREKRAEWATVGMLGKLVCIDDGTCEVNGYCKPSNGIATKSDIGYRVLARLDETHIKVLFK